MLKIQYEDQLKNCMLIEFFLKEYAARKFHLDIENRTIDLEMWRNCYISLARYVVENMMIHEEYVEYDGRVVKFHDVVYSRKIYILLGKYGYEISLVLNSIITVYHNRVTEDHRYIFPLDHITEEHESKIQSAITSYESELKFLRDACVKYGYYPYDLMCLRDPLKLAEEFVTKHIHFVNPFVRIIQNCKDNVYINHNLGSDGKFFEKELPGTYYFYLNIENYDDINNTITAVKKNLSRMKKRNNKYSTIIHEKATVQLCICIDKKEFDLEDCVKQVRSALLNTVAFTKVHDVTDLNLTRDALWHALEGKNKKISYFNRLVGLYLWDCVFIQKKKVGFAIGELINTKEFLKQYCDHCGKDKYFEFEPANIQREYELARDCIESLSILPHGSRTK